MKNKEKSENEMKLFRGIGNNVKCENVMGSWWTTSLEVARSFAGKNGVILEKNFVPSNPIIINYENNSKFGRCQWIDRIIESDEAEDADCLIIENIVEIMDGYENPSATSVLIFGL